jgi:hypothetical protein
MMMTKISALVVFENKIAFRFYHGLSKDICREAIHIRNEMGTLYGFQTVEATKSHNSQTFADYVT